MKTALVAVSALLLVVILAVVGWQAGWWLKQSTVNHQNKITRSSYEYQTAQRQLLETDLSQIAALDAQIATDPQNATPLTAQKRALENSYCTTYATVQGSGELTPDLIQFASQACTTPTP